MRDASDRLCREHGLSIIEEPKGKDFSYKFYQMEKAGMPTRYNTARDALNEAISKSRNLYELKAHMKSMGYQCNFAQNRKYWTITLPGWKKPIRTHKLGEEYSRENIEKRVYANYQGAKILRVREVKRNGSQYSLKRRVDKIMGRSSLEKLYLRYCYELGYLPKYKQNPSKVHSLLKDELLKCEMYSEEAKLLAKHHISDMSELAAHKEMLLTGIGSLEEDRDKLRLKAKRKIPEDERSLCKEEIAGITCELKYYRSYHAGAAKTLKSIQITLAARLEKFNLESLAALTITDELELEKLGEKKCAIFALIPDNDTSFNFLVSILYTQLFQQLFEVADKKYGGSLPVHVHFLMDEFANVSLPDDFDKILSVMRSRGVSVSIILQNLAQLKALFEKQWESIVGNCDEFVYLGGNEQATHKYVSELLGKETIDTNTYGRSYGICGNYSKNDQQSGRELLMPDEVRMLDNQFALLFVRGERPVKDLKFDILTHPNIKLTQDGKAEPFFHGDTSGAAFTIELTNAMDNSDVELPAETGYELLSEADVEKLFND